MNLSFLFSNTLINVGVVSWIAAQLIKTLSDFIKHRQFDKRRLAGSGGMPSSHSAVTCSVLLSSYYEYGFNSPVFALAFIFALVVMYDATGVRWAAGLHAKAINHIVEYLEKADGDEKQTLEKKTLQQLIPTLNESLGHRVIEVICGAILGFAVSVVFHLVK